MKQHHKIIIWSLLSIVSYLTEIQAQHVKWKGKEDAANRIKKIRKGDLTINVADEQGNPVKNAQVEVKMTRNAFDFGCVINANTAFTDEGPNPDMETYLNLYESLFNTSIIENGMKWRMMVDNKSGESRNEIREKVWRCIEWLDEKKIPVRGTNVLWPSWENMPEYLKNHEGTPKKLTYFVDQRIEEAMTMYKDRLYEWDFVNEPVHHRDLLNIHSEQELIRWFTLAKNYDSQTPLYINQWYALNGTYHSEYLDMLQMLADANAPVDGIGLQGHLFAEQLTDEDELEEIWNKLNQYASFGLPIQITELDINGDQGEGLQAEALENALTLFYSHPAIKGVTIWGFWEGLHWRSDEEAALWNLDFTPKKAGKTWEKLVLNDWTTNETLKTDDDGITSLRCFTGEYEVIVTKNGKTARQVINIPRQGRELMLIVQ